MHRSLSRCRSNGAGRRPLPIDLDLIHQKAFSIKKPPWGGGRISSQGLAFFASGRQDSNLRHLAPKARDSFSRFRVFPVCDSVLVMLLGCELSAGVGRYFAFCARFAHVLRTLGIARCLCRFAARRRCSPLDQAISRFGSHLMWRGMEGTQCPWADAP